MNSQKNFYENTYFLSFFDKNKMFFIISEECLII